MDNRQKWLAERRQSFLRTVKTKDNCLREEIKEKVALNKIGKLADMEITRHVSCFFTSKSFQF